jgi:GTP pyrophosphokinase
VISIEERYEKLEQKVKGYLPTVDVSRLREVFEYAAKQHEDQLRKDGSPFVSHPLAVADLVTDLGLDLESVMAALLHDCIEDTSSTYEEVAHKFGATVADLVDGVTKLTRVQYTSKEEEQMENLRKMLMAMAKDIRVILIKICDRMHNIRTMEYQSERKQREKSLETLEIYAPIAHRLGMQRMKWELEDLSLKYLDPIAYHEIADELAKQAQLQETFMSSIQRSIQTRLAEEHIRGTVYGRIKHIYSIYRKMYIQNKNLSEIFDLYAFRVIVDDIPSCYNVLGVIHDLYKPILGRFKDYIGTPKPNLYQSLHTTVIGSEGMPFEVQIRTWDMHHTAEYGVAAHWKYKQGLNLSKNASEEVFAWVRRLLETQQDTDAEEYVRTLKVDLFADEVFVFTPQGDVINLPAGATPIDFAYTIHSAVGNGMVAAKVNGRIVNFDYRLNSGQIVEVVTAKNARGPSRDWIKLAKSNEARTKIRQWFKREKREENIAHGRSMFESELKHLAIPMALVIGEEILPHVLKKVRFGSLDEMYAAIGYGGASAQKCANRVKEELVYLNRIQAEKATAEKVAAEPAPVKVQVESGVANTGNRKRSASGVIVEDMTDCMVKFAKCCTPVPGDEIVGFVTRGYGVSVHRSDCPNAAISRRKPEEKDRWVFVSWDQGSQNTYKTALELTAKDRDGLTLDVAMILSSAKLRLLSLAANSLPDGYAKISAVLEVKNSADVRTVMNKLNQISGVYQVTRVSG